MRTRAALVIALVALAVAGWGASSAEASPRAPFQAKVRHTAVHGGQIAWYERGSGPPLMMLMGTGSTMAEWDPALLALLARHHRLVMFDYPGIGWSGPWRAPQTFAGLADDVARFMGAIGVGKADVLGWSMGGFIAQQLAIRHSSRVTHLVLAGTNPGGGRAVLGTKEHQELDSNPDPSLAEILGDELYPPNELQEGYKFAHRLDTASQSGVIPNDFHVPAATVNAQVAAENPWLLSNANFRALGVLPMPVLATGGREDPVVPPINLVKIARQVPDAHLRLFAGAHAFLFQQRVAFAKVVDGFLAG
ncbi:MAG: alpha/beta hydrolase [Actinobacteria bacterium]|nr:alpha/beta hydrolase [Actinomycetota bacterium]